MGRLLRLMFFHQYGVFSAKKESKDTDKARHYGVDWRVFTFYVGGIVRLKQS